MAVDVKADSVVQLKDTTFASLQAAVAELTQEGVEPTALIVNFSTELRVSRTIPPSLLAQVQAAIDPKPDAPPPDGQQGL